MSTLCTICARGGSTGLPRKNIKTLAGKPLIAHTIAQALVTPGIDRVVVSTDDDEIAAIAREHGAEVPFRRPAELSTSSAPKLPVIRHAVETMEQLGMKVDRIVDLDPTSPLRLVQDVIECLALLDATVDVVITGYPSEKNPYFNMIERKPDGNIGLIVPGRGTASRQAAPPVWSMNASVSVWHRSTLELGLWDGRVRLHVMPRERSIDIDSALDFRLVEMLMAEAEK